MIAHASLETVGIYFIYSPGNVRLQMLSLPEHISTLFPMSLVVATQATRTVSYYGNCQISNTPTELNWMKSLTNLDSRI